MEKLELFVEYKIGTKGEYRVFYLEINGKKLYFKPYNYDLVNTLLDMKKENKL